MKNFSMNQNLNIYEQDFTDIKHLFISELGFCRDKGQKLIHYLADKNEDPEFLIECHNLITHQWRDRIYTLSKKYIDDLSKWCIYYDGSLLHNAVIDDDGIWLSNCDNFKLGNTKRDVHRIFEIDTDYFLFHKMFGKYLFIEKQGLNNQIWTKDMKELIIELKRTKLELDHYKKGIL